jgi:DNA-binding HxlR family transcriptional regulator
MEELIKVLWDMFGADKAEKKDLSAPGRKRTVHILPLIINALSNEKRRKILVLLLGDKDTKFSFARIKEELSPIKNEPLNNHLQFLQKAWLVNRTVNLSDQRIQEDPYYSFYQLSDFGFKILDWLADFLIMVENDYLSKK